MSIIPVYLRCRIFEENARKVYGMSHQTTTDDLRKKLADICIEVSSPPC